MVQTDNGNIFVESKDPLEEKLEGCAKNSKLVIQIDQENGKVSLKIDKNPPKVLCIGSDIILGKEPLYFVSGLFFKKDRLKIKNVDKLMEKIENKMADKMQEKMQEKLGKLKINKEKESKAEDSIVVDTFEEKVPSPTIDKVLSPTIDETKTDVAPSEYTVNSGTKNEVKKDKKPSKPKPKPSASPESKDKISKSSNPLMGLLFGGSTKTAAEEEVDSDEERQKDFENEFDALNEPSDQFY